MGVSQGRIRQRLTARTLFGIQTSMEWRLPPVQFTADGLPLRGLDRVLPALPEDVHPIVVNAFMQRPHEDLGITGTATSPREWLVSGGDIEAVVLLAAGLHDLP